MRELHIYTFTCTKINVTLLGKLDDWVFRLHAYATTQLVVATLEEEIKKFMQIEYVGHVSLRVFHTNATAIRNICIKLHKT